MVWKYIEGSEKDFERSPQNAVECIFSDKGSKDHLVGWLTSDNMLIGINGYKEKFEGLYGYRKFVTAKRVWVEDDESQQTTESIDTVKYEPVFLPVEQETEKWDGKSVPLTGTICKLKVEKEFYTHDGVTLFPAGTQVEVGGIVNFKLEGEMIAVKIKGTSCRDAIPLKSLMPL